MKPHGDQLLAAMPVPKAFFKLAVPAVACLLCVRFVSYLAFVHDRV